MRRLYLLILCTALSASLYAQKDLNLNDIFAGKGIDKSRTTETIIKGEQLEPYRLTSFHSIKFNATEKERDDLEKAFHTYLAQNAAKTDKEATNCEMENRNGHLYYAIAEVKPDSPFERRYICYQCSGAHGTFGITLVSLQGHVSLQDLRRMFKKK